MNIVIKKSESFLKLEQGLSKLIEYCNMEITDLVSKKTASDNLGALKNAVKSINEKKKEILEPYIEAKKKFDADVKALIEPAEEAIDKLNRKFVAYVLEQERIAREQAEIAKREELKRLADEKALLEQNILAMAESVGDESLVNEAIISNQIADERIKSIESQDIIIKTKASKGDQFTTGLRYSATASILDKKKALEFVLKSGRFELIEFVPANVVAYAKTKLGEDKSKVIEEDGFKFYYKASTMSR